MAPPTNLDKAENERAVLASSLTIIENAILVKATTLISETDAELYLDQVKDMRIQLQENQLAITNTKPSDMSTHNADFSDLSRRIFKATSQLMDHLKSFVQPPPLTNTARCSIKLPPIDIPTFTGKYEDWSAFMDLYESMIHFNTLLSEASKLTYLKKYVSGDAEVLIKNLKTTNSNYNEAWTLLKNRYDNKREIVYAQVRRLFALQAVKQCSAVAIQTLLDQTNECVRALNGLGEPTDDWDTILVYMTVDKLDNETKRQWALTLRTTDLPSYRELCDFLEQHVRGLHAFQIPTNKQQPQQEKRANAHVASSSNAINSNICVVCKGTHPIYKCSKFLDMSVKERSDFVSKSKLCFNCLRPSSKQHNADSCKSSSCRTCNKKHNSLLHYQRTQQQQQSTSGNSNPQSNSSTLSSHHIRDGDRETDVLLATAIVSVADVCGEHHNARILLDDGSQATLISESYVQMCGFKRKWDRTRLTGIGGTDAGYTKGKVELKLLSNIHNEDITITALIVNTVTSDLPHLPCVDNYDHLAGIVLADPNYHKPGPIDILIGGEYKGFVKSEGKIARADRTGPIAKNTIFGWVVSGRVQLQQINTVRVRVNMCETDSILQRYFEMENVQSPKHLTAEEKECEQHFLQTFSRDTNGRFCVQLPFNEKVNGLGHSREMAIKRWQAVERRLAKNPAYAAEYSKFMQEYVDLGHMKNIPRAEVSEVSAGSSNKTYYLPHHFVVKPDSTTTKFRVVFDASAKTSSGLSLNDCLKVGATLQDDIFSLLLRFRQHKIAIKSDIAKMFRQFRVCEEHCNYQRILWRARPSDPLEEFKLMTVTYGTASAPFLSTRCLIELGELSKTKLPSSSLKLQKDCYVDDIMSGTDTEEEAIQLVNELNEIGLSAGLSFRKFSTNSMKVLDTIPPELRESKEPLSFDKESNVKALGIQWNAMSDNFSFHRPELEPSSVKLTKRLVLSQLARVFDPLGLLSPVTINAKLFMQFLWKCSLGWDDNLTDDICAKWHIYIDQLSAIESIQIPRYVKHPDSCELSLHGFCDASEKAYGAVVYVRCKYSDENYSVHMLCAKSRVAPLKTVSLPRLELCGALLLAELIESVKISLDVDCDVFAWSDSMITLQWLASHPGRWQTFVANRVAKIQEIVPFTQWSHVKSEENPADLVSRGVTATLLDNSNLWWNGPDWLSSNQLPTSLIVAPVSSSKLLEERKNPIFISHVRSCHVSVNVKDDLCERYSSLNKLRRAAAILIRFSKFVINKQINNNPFQPYELEEALMSIVRITQQQAFPEEYDLLSKGLCVGVKSKLLSLNPFLDKNKVMCVGGRLTRAEICDSAKHPIIIPHNTHFAKLLILHSHLIHGHAGNKLVWCNLRDRWWILNARNSIRFQIRKCVKCRRFRAQSMSQLMGNLPPSRVTAGRAFLQTGVDYAGPFNIRVMKGRSNKTFKGYMCIFICMATKAVHIEAVGDMTTETFLSSFRRFISRRGVPISMHSDCGTNFVGADNELTQLLSDPNHNRVISNQLSDNNISWEFNPPSSPHHGGLWEAAVKSAKMHLKHVIGDQTLTFEEFSTVLCEVEACLNSRPIGALTSDPEDLDVLTPGHFLIGQPLTSIPFPDITQVKLNRLSRWQLTQQIQQHFWKRWQVEYLSTLQQRWKWKTKNRNISVGDLCVLMDENLPPTKWKLVRVIETHAGLDGLVRRVTIKTSNGILDRPITKLSPILFVEEQ